MVKIRSKIFFTVTWCFREGYWILSSLFNLELKCSINKFQVLILKHNKTVISASQLGAAWHIADVTKILSFHTIFTKSPPHITHCIPDEMRKLWRLLLTNILWLVEFISNVRSVTWSCLWQSHLTPQQQHVWDGHGWWCGRGSSLETPQE